MNGWYLLYALSLIGTVVYFFMYAVFFKIFVCNCRIPDDWIDNKRYPLFIGRLVMSELFMQFSKPSIPDSSFAS